MCRLSWYSPEEILWGTSEAWHFLIWSSASERLDTSERQAWKESSASCRRWHVSHAGRHHTPGKISHKASKSADFASYFVQDVDSGWIVEHPLKKRHCCQNFLLVHRVCEGVFDRCERSIGGRIGKQDCPRPRQDRGSIEWKIGVSSPLARNKSRLSGKTETRGF